MENKKVSEIEIVSAGEVTNIEDTRTLCFSTSYIFEGKAYESIDLSGLYDISCSDLIEAQKYIARSGEITPTPELSLNYACFIAARKTGKPIEFFHQLPAKEAIKLKNRVIDFFY